jgi:hypothetical protein
LFCDTPEGWQEACPRDVYVIDVTSESVHTPECGEAVIATQLSMMSPTQFVEERTHFADA